MSKKQIVIEAVERHGDVVVVEVNGRYGVRTGAEYDSFMEANREAIESLVDKIAELKPFFDQKVDSEGVRYNTNDLKQFIELGR